MTRSLSGKTRIRFLAATAVLLLAGGVAVAGANEALGPLQAAFDRATGHAQTDQVPDGLPDEAGDPGSQADDVRQDGDAGQNGVGVQGEGVDGEQHADDVHGTLSGNDSRPGDEDFGESVSENAQEGGADFGSDVADTASQGASEQGTSVQGADAADDHRQDGDAPTGDADQGTDAADAREGNADRASDHTEDTPASDRP